VVAVQSSKKLLTEQKKRKGGGTITQGPLRPFPKKKGIQKIIKSERTEVTEKRILGYKVGVRKSGPTLYFTEDQEGSHPGQGERECTEKGNSGR